MGMRNLKKYFACVLGCLISTIAITTEVDDKSMIKFNENINLVDINNNSVEFKHNIHVNQLSGQTLNKQLIIDDKLERINFDDLLLQNENKPNNDVIINNEQLMMGGTVFFEDFQGQVLPANWAVFDVDGNTPVPELAFFDEAWKIIESTIGGVSTGNYVASSISYYAPAGTSNDWIITPQITIGTDDTLSWLEATLTAEFPDGYEVYISTTTQDVAGCSSSSPVFSKLPGEVATDALSLEFVNLFAAGYSNQSIYVCFRNNTTNGFLLEIDNVRVTEPPFNNVQNDVAITGVSFPEYTLVPDSIGYVSENIVFRIYNKGFNTQSNLTINVIVKLDGESIQEGTVTFNGSLNYDEDTILSLGNLIVQPGSRGLLTVSLEVVLDGIIDENPSDNVINDYHMLFINGKQMARDDGNPTKGLNIGDVNGAQIGQTFVIDQTAKVESISFLMGNSNCDEMTLACSLDNLEITADVYSVDSNTNKPLDVIASTEAFLVPVGENTYSINLQMLGGPISLMSGSYVVVVNSPVDSNPNDSLIPSVGIVLTDNRFTQGTTWLDLGGKNNWRNLENVGFFKTPIIRLVFVDADIVFVSGFESD